jgi:hypothetical protein
MNPVCWPIKNVPIINTNTRIEKDDVPDEGDNDLFIVQWICAACGTENNEVLIEELIVVVNSSKG